jgi:hypothetical protein
LHHPSELIGIAFVLTVLIPALGALSMCLLIWKVVRQLDPAYIGVLVLVITTVPLLFAANAHYLGGSVGETVGPYSWQDFLLSLVAWPVVYFFLTIAGLISLPVVFRDRFRSPVSTEIKTLVTVIVLILAILQCGIDFELHVLRSS